jgi:signal transduction histidine kinase
MLTGLRMELAAIARSGAASNPEVHTALERAKSNTEHTLSAVRNIAMLLRPSMLDDLGLTPALIWLAKEMERSSGMEIRREIDDRVDQLPDSHRTCLYRVVQEALNNAVQHSGARSVELRVSARDGWIRVEVVDDGRGFLHQADNRKGLGLIGMEERVRELGGQMHVATLSGRGASVEILLPQPAPFEEKHDNSTYRGRSRNRADRVETTL